LESQGRLEKYVATLPPVSVKRLADATRLHKLMTKDDLRRELSTHAMTLTMKERQLDALKERYEHAGQLQSAAETQAAMDCHKVQFIYTAH